MAIIECIIKTSREDITGQFDVDSINKCIVHGVKPHFYKHIRKNKRKAAQELPMLTANCIHEDCNKICYADGDILAIWNKWNPK